MSFTTNPLTGQLQAATSLVSLSEACREFVAEAKAAAALLPQDIGQLLPPVAYVVESTWRGGRLHEALNATMFKWARNSVTSKASVLALLTGVYACMSIVLVLVAL